MWDITRELWSDFVLLPSVVDRYTYRTPRREALKASRQVAGVTHYLSLMATETPQMEAARHYGVAITAIDEVTDEWGKRLSDGTMEDALNGTPRYPPMEAVCEAAEMAESDLFGPSLKALAVWQDRSLRQLGSISIEEVKEITWRKGAYSCLANLAMVKSDISEEEREVALQLGATLQLLDDYLDQPKDKQSGISTVFTKGVSSRRELHEAVTLVSNRAEDVWGDSGAHRRLFDVMALHHRLGYVENNTPFRASWFAPGYL